MNLKDSDLKKIIALLESMSETIDKVQRYIKPREADKARQARLMLKKLKKTIEIMKQEKMKRIKELSAELIEIAKEERIPLILAYEEGEGFRLNAIGSPIQVAIMIDHIAKDNNEIRNAMAGIAFMNMLGAKKELDDAEKEVADGK